MFSISEVRRSLLDGMSYSSVKDVGILFWLNDVPESNIDVISVVSTAKNRFLWEKNYFYCG